MPAASATPQIHRPLPPSFNAYVTLGLPSYPAPPPSAQELKAAYRRALLASHPDKLVGGGEGGGKGAGAGELAGAGGLAGAGKLAVTIDDITLAYRTLSTPSLRNEHDRALRLRSTLPATTGATSSSESEPEPQRLGLETIDLDDMAHDAEKGVWWRGCRCGEERGFVVGETQLEEGVFEDGRAGEVLLGCGGCSLWVRVGFAVEEGDGEEEEEGV